MDANKITSSHLGGNLIRFAPATELKAWQDAIINTCLPMYPSPPAIDPCAELRAAVVAIFIDPFGCCLGPKRKAMCALYAFARVTDDLGDCDEPTALRTTWLDWWRQATALNLIGEGPADRVILPDGPVESTEMMPIDLHQKAKMIFPALRDTLNRCEIPTRYLLEIVDGVLADQQKTRFDTYEQLEHYCYLVASAVGLACLHIWGFDGPVPTEKAIDCGLAFQLTNILRDVSEDARRGRIYLPRQHYEQHGLCEDDLLHPRPDDRLRCLLMDEIARARQLYISGWEVWDTMHADGRPMFSMMWRTYRRLLDRIADDPGGVAVRRVSLSSRERLGLVSRHFLAPMYRRLPVPPCGSLWDVSVRRRVIIVGGGLAGMAAAEALARMPESFDVQLLESKQVLGGRTGSFTDASGDSIDYCQHVAMGCCTNLLGLLGRCDLSDELVRYRELEFHHPQFAKSKFTASKLAPAPLHLAGTIGRLNYLSKSQKREIRRGLWKLMRTPTGMICELTAGQWLRRAGQRRRSDQTFFGT